VAQKRSRHLHCSCSSVSLVGVQFLERQPLAHYTTMGVGGAARWFAEAQTENEIAEALEFAEGRSIPCFVLGGGSNVVVPDEGYPGLVLRVALQGLESAPAGDARHYSVAAGEPWDPFVARTVSDGVGGMECLSGIPGTVGGTPVQNVGAYGQEVSETVHLVRALDRTTGKAVEFSKGECGFAYRRSRFNREDRGRFIITRVEYQLNSESKPAVRYHDLKRYFQNDPEPSLEQVRRAVLEIRDGKGMLIATEGKENHSAGSFFKNPVVSAARAQEVESRGSANGGMPRFPAWLIEQAGFHKGFVLGRAGISSRHTLALVNLGGATAAELFALRDRIVSGVQERFGVGLEMEPEILS
jgi:UDP-N-acetylmuramate dehydrogenase